jgi:hypothetical protein
MDTNPACPSKQRPTDSMRVVSACESIWKNARHLHNTGYQRDAEYYQDHDSPGISVVGAHRGTFVSVMDRDASGFIARPGPGLEQ